jgi:hypothetical protein
LYVGERGRPIFRHELAELGLEPGNVQVAAVNRIGQNQRDVGQEPRVFLPKRHQKEHQMFAKIGTHVPDHSEIKKVDPILPPLQIARVGIRMKESIYDNLLVVALEELTSRLRSFWTLWSLYDGHSLDFFHHEDPGGGQILVHNRDIEAIVALEYAAHSLDVRSLLAEVELAVQRRGQVLEHSVNVDELLKRWALPDPVCEQLEEGEILLDFPTSSWPLRLEDDSFAASESRTMDLSDRAGGDGGRIDRLENVLPGHAQFLFRNPNHFVFGHRRQMVLSRRSLVRVDWSRFTECGETHDHLARPASPGPSRDRIANHSGEKGHGDREHAGPFVLAFVQKLARSRRDNWVRSVAQMGCRHHGAQGRLDGRLRI